MLISSCEQSHLLSFLVVADPGEFFECLHICCRSIDLLVL